MAPQYVVAQEDWEERFTKSKQKIEALELDEFNDCYLFSTLVTSFRNGLDYNDTSKDNEKKAKNIFLAIVEQSLKEKHSFFQKSLHDESNDLGLSNSDIIQNFLCVKDSEEGNTALHFATKKTDNQEEIIDSIPLILQMLKDKADVSLINNKGRNFLKMLYLMPDEWFDQLVRNEDNEEVLDFFFEQKDEPDFYLETIFKRLRKISKKKKEDCRRKNNECFPNGGPIRLCEKIFGQRDNDFKKSFDELLAWHLECHDYNLEEIQLCCFHLLHDREEAFVIIERTESIIQATKKPLKRSYYLKKALNITFLGFLFVKISDFVLDLTVSIKYSVYYKEAFIEDLPSKENCTEANFPIAC